MKANVARSSNNKYSSTLNAIVPTFTEHDGITGDTH